MRIKIGAKFSPRTPFFNDQTQKAISIYNRISYLSTTQSTKNNEKKESIEHH